jgi:hypothetical protein
MTPILRKILLLIILIVAAIAVHALSQFAPRLSTTPSLPGENPAGGTILASGPITVRGSFVCLPHRDTSGPTTMECAFGLKAENGVHYGVDFSSTPGSAFDYPMEKTHIVKGDFTPVETLPNDDRMGIYAIEGVIKVTSVEEVVSDIPTAPANLPITMSLIKPVVVNGTTLSVTAVTEDSRCPSDVTCVWAGRAVLSLSVTPASGSGTATSTTITIGQTISTDTLSITLDEVTPYPTAGKKIADGEYRFTFTVKNK